MAGFLQEKFNDKLNPTYVVKEIKQRNVDLERAEAKFKIFKAIDGSTKFQVILFTPCSDSIKAANRICICNECELEFGSCDLFKT